MPARRRIDRAFPARGGVVGWALGGLIGLGYALAELRLEPVDALAGYAAGAAAGTVVGAAAGTVLALVVRLVRRDRTQPRPARAWVRHRHG